MAHVSHRQLRDPISPQSKASQLRLIDQVRAAIRLRHYSPRTEEAYVSWLRRFIVFHGKRHPREMGAQEVTDFLSNLAARGASASTQNQALSAILFLYEIAPVAHMPTRLSTVAPRHAQPALQSPYGLRR